MLDQQKKIEQLQEELDRVNKLLESRKMIMRRAGSIAEASLRISEVFDAAQKAADRYIMSVRASYERGVLEEAKADPDAEADSAESIEDPGTGETGLDSVFSEGTEDHEPGESISGENADA